MSTANAAPTHLMTLEELDAKVKETLQVFDATKKEIGEGILNLAKRAAREKPIARTH